MLKAVLQKGVIVPMEPLPAEWEEGSALEVAKTDAPALDIDAWAESMNQLCADSSTEDEDVMRHAAAIALGPQGSRVLPGTCRGSGSIRGRE